ERVDPLVVPVGEDEYAVDGRPRLTAVLLDSVPCVPRGRKELLRAVRGLTHHRGAATFGASRLDPPHLVPDEVGPLWWPADFGGLRCADGGCPASVRCDCRHGSHLATDQRPTVTDFRTVRRVRVRHR